MPKELENNQTSTKEFIALVNENTNSDFQWFSTYTYIKTTYQFLT